MISHFAKKAFEHNLAMQDLNENKFDEYPFVRCTENEQKIIDLCTSFPNGSMIKKQLFDIFCDLKQERISQTNLYIPFSKMKHQLKYRQIHHANENINQEIKRFVEIEYEMNKYSINKDA